VDDAVNQAEKVGPPRPEEMFLNTCGELSRRQQKEMKVRTDADT
jgi:hypothetical protein